MKHSLPVFLLLPLTAFSQMAETPQKRGLWLGLSFSPDMINRTTASKNDNFEEVLDELERYDIGYTFGVSVLCESDDRLTWEGGVQYSKKGYRTEDQILVFPGPADPLYGWVEYHFSYFDLPFKLIYKLFKKGNFFLSSGIILNVKLQDDFIRVSYYADGRREEENLTIYSAIDYKPISAGIVAGFGGDVNIGKNSKLRIEPIFRHMITPINDGVVKYYLWSAGLNVGFYHRL